MRLPKVSVATITYAHEKYIVDTIKGVLSQNYQGEIEFIIANDNSPDNTDKVINDYLKSVIIPSNIAVKYVKHSVNKGIMNNFIWTLNECTGEYIALCEGDDYWTDPLKLEKQVDFLEKNDQFGLVYTDVNKVDSKNNLLENNFLSLNQFSKSNDFEDFLILAPFRAPCTWLFRKDLLDINYLNNDKIIGDLTILLNISSKASTFFMRDVTANYMVLDSSASHFKSSLSQYLFNQKVLYTQLSFATNENQKNIIETNFVVNNLRYYLKYGIRGFDYFWKYRRNFNFFKKSLIILKKIF